MRDDTYAWNIGWRIANLTIVDRILLIHIRCFVTLIPSPQGQGGMLCRATGMARTVRECVCICDIYDEWLLFLPSRASVHATHPYPFISIVHIIPRTRAWKLSAPMLPELSRQSGGRWGPPGRGGQPPTRAHIMRHNIALLPPPTHIEARFQS